MVSVLTAQAKEMVNMGHCRTVPPLIIIGMHRSGTTMVAEMLEQCGLFSGVKKDPNHESLFFQGKNDWIMRECGATWDHPEPMHYLADNKELHTLIKDYLLRSMKAPAAIRYLGWKKYMQYRSPVNLDIPWGWKDPRNTYTLPIWLDVFPGAKVIHIFRHGVDVASSLKIRQDKVLAYETAAYEQRKARYSFKSKNGRFTDSVRCLTLAGSFSLWEEYMQEARKRTAGLGNRVREIKYEDFIANPGAMLKDLTGFCGLPADEKLIAHAAGKVKTGRAYAYTSDKVLQDFEGQVLSRLRANGY